MIRVSTACPFEPGTPVYSYLRHSPGDNQTIDSQEAAVRAWCAEHSLNLVRVFKDEARTGSTTAGRAQFLLMIDALRESKPTLRVTGVVLWSFSRFARDYDDAEFYKADVRRRGYIIHSLTDQIPDGPFGRVIESITHWKDEERLREISKDAQRGLRWLAEQGYAVGGFPPRGYKRSAAFELGRKRSGEPRLAYKWEIDPALEDKVRLAWSMKLAGESLWATHRVTRIFDSVNSYPTFFRNLTYAGFRKCKDLQVPNAHPAYVSKEEFDRVQELLSPSRKLGGVPDHPRRKMHDNPYLLSGALYCGYCEAAMVGDTNGSKRFYVCNRRKRQGHEVCPQSALVAPALHRMVTDWLTQEVLTLSHLVSVRDEVQLKLSAVQSELEQRDLFLRTERDQIARKMQNLVSVLEERGWSAEVETRLAERKAEKSRIEGELREVTFLRMEGQLRVSDEALQYLSAHLNAALTIGAPEDAREVIRSILVRAELYKEKLVLHYTPPVLEGRTFNPISGFNSVPPREFEGSIYRTVLVPEQMTEPTRTG